MLGEPAGHPRDILVYKVNHSLQIITLIKLFLPHERQNVVKLNQSLARKSVNLLIAAADRFEEVSDSLALPIAFLVQRELEEANQIEVVLLQVALFDFCQAHALDFSQSL